MKYSSFLSIIYILIHFKKIIFSITDSLRPISTNSFPPSPLLLKFSNFQPRRGWIGTWLGSIRQTNKNGKLTSRGHAVVPDILPLSRSIWINYPIFHLPPDIRCPRPLLRTLFKCVHLRITLFFFILPFLSYPFVPRSPPSDGLDPYEYLRSRSSHFVSPNFLMVA